MPEVKTVEQQAFQIYATSTAFRIELSKRQIKTMKSIDRNEQDSFREGLRKFRPCNGNSVLALQRRGFVDLSGIKLTKIGEIVMRLIEIADV